MKIAKKIFVGIMAIAMLVSCFTLFASAEATERPVESFDSVLEYLTKDTYLIETYEGQEVGANYEFTPDYFTFEKSDAAVVTVAGGADGKYLSISNNSIYPVGYKLYSEDGGYGYFVTSFDFKTGDANGTNGADVVVKATLGDYFDDIILFAAKTSKDSAKEFVYSDYDYERAIYNTVKAEAVPELGVWYHVEVTFTPDAEMYRVKIVKGDELVLDFKDTIDKSAKKIDSVRIFVNDAEDAGATVTCFDNVAAYEGTAARDVVNRDQTLAELALKIDQYAKDELTPIDDKVEVAEFYKKFYYGSDPYEAPEGTANKDQLDEIKAGAQKYIDRTYLEALEAYAEAVVDVEGYYEKLAYLGDETTESATRAFYNYFNGKTAEDFDGLTDEEIGAALKAYDDSKAQLAKIKSYSEAFVKTIERNYDPKNKDFSYMQLKYAALSTLVDQIAQEYKYIDYDPDTEYPTVADAYAVYETLENKLSEIAYNASGVFMPAVEAMDTTQADAVSKESPYLTVDFEALYENYLIASSVYANGTVHDKLDPATYPGLADAITKYLADAEYIEARIADCNSFIDAIRAAESSTYYKTLRAQLANAAEYLDENKEKSLEKYAGVEEAIALYEPLVLALENSEKAADAYIAAVNAINIDAPYAELRVSVANARALKAAGALLGYDGVTDADAKFAKADARLSVLEGHSSTLLYAVEALKTATTLAERRELIFIGLGAKDGSEENISGVTAAKAELATQIQKYNEDVARVNALFAGVVGNSASSISSVAPTNGVIFSAEVIEALLK